MAMLELLLEAGLGPLADGQRKALVHIQAKLSETQQELEQLMLLGRTEAHSLTPAMHGLDLVRETWAIVVAIILGIPGALIGSRFNVASQLHLSAGTSSLTLAGLVSLIVTLFVMLIASGLGGWVGARYHEKVDRDVGATP